MATPQGSPTTLVNGQRQILEGEQAGDLRGSAPVGEAAGTDGVATA